MLKYLFKVTYKDGSTYEQNTEDKSVIKGQGSSFSDVKQDEVAVFSLVGEHTYSVFLDDGHFEVDGVPFFMHEHSSTDNEQNKGGLRDFRLIFFRRHTHNFNKENKTGEVVSQDHEIVYRMGWQANDISGKNYQHVMQIY